MKSWAALFLLIGFSFSASQVHAACDPRGNPHSFDCQHATFEGELFPLANLTRSGALNRTWFANQYTPGSRQGIGLFQTVISGSSSLRTCALLNDDGSRVGNLQIAVSGRGIRAARLANFRSQDFESNRPGGFEDTQTAVFANTATSQIFQCRVFVRAQTPHLTCRYFEDKQFMGYVGFLPAQTSCR